MEDRKRLLIVDDCTETSQTLAALLWLWGYEVQLAHDGPRALQIAPIFQPHGVLLDIGLPGMDGFEVARALRCQHGLEKILLLAVTGYPPAESPGQAHEAGFDHYLVKPVDPMQLQELLEGARHEHAVGCSADQPPRTHSTPTTQTTA